MNLQNLKHTGLQQFAIMGSIYVKAMLGIKNPKVGLISNGVEDHKGPIKPLLL